MPGSPRRLPCVTVAAVSPADGAHASATVRKAVKRRQKAKGRLTSGTYFLIPTVVLDSPAFRSLSTKSKALLLDMGAQIRGRHNNGDISATYNTLRERGWNSKETIANALAELLAKGLIEKTRQGFLRRCSLFAFTWWGIEDAKGKLDVRPNPVPSNLWRHYRKNTAPTPISGAKLPR